MKNILPAIESAKLLAGEISIRYKLTVPIDVKLVARSLGVKIEEHAFAQDAVSGFLKMKNKEGKPVIVVNKNDGEMRRRFTVAHEIGHFLMHSNYPVHIDPDTHGVYFRDEISSQAIDLKEIQANRFAAELLMPTEDVKNRLRKKIDDGVELLTAAEELSKHYKVSTTAMTVKISSMISVI